MKKNYFVHTNGICESQKVGKNSKIWAFTHVLPGATIGEDCNICDHVFIENDVVLGDRVTVKCGVQIWDGTRIGSNVFIGPNASFTNDKFPRSKQYPEKFASIQIDDGASIGANATLLPGITIGQNAMIGAGSVVTRSVPPNAIVYGNPAVIRGYVDVVKQSSLKPTSGNLKHSLSIDGAKVVKIPSFADMRGNLIAGEFSTDLPFVPKRFFLVYGVPNQMVRGEHAHKKCAQLLVCVSGSVNVVMDDGRRRDEVLLESPDIGVLIPPMVWGVQYRYKPGSVLMCLASDAYDPDDYIRDYDEFKKLVAE